MSSGRAGPRRPRRRIHGLWRLLLEAGRGIGTVAVVTLLAAAVALLASVVVAALF